jgi:hypothetical protein
MLHARVVAANGRRESLNLRVGDGSAPERLDEKANRISAAAYADYTGIAGVGEAPGEPNSKKKRLGGSVLPS